MYQDNAPLATPNDAMHEFARNVGRERPESAWILTPYDVWQANPFYTGPKVAHPESDNAWDEEPLYNPAPFPVVDDNDDIPF